MAVCLLCSFPTQGHRWMARQIERETDKVFYRWWSSTEWSSLIVVFTIAYVCPPSFVSDFCKYIANLIYSTNILPKGLKTKSCLWPLSLSCEFSQGHTQKTYGATPNLIRVYSHLSGLCAWASSSKVKHRQFNSQSRHMPGLQARSPIGALKRQPHSDVSLPLFLPPFLSKNK